MVQRKARVTGVRMTFRRFVQALASAVLLAAMLPGCAPSISIRPPTPADIARVKDSQVGIALIRIHVSIDGKPLSPLDPGDSNNTLRLYLASLDDMGAPTRVQPASPSPIAAAAGWHYLMLPPGVYYLLVLPPGVEQNPPAVAYHADSARYGRLTHYVFEPGRGGFWSPDLMAFVLAGMPPADFRELQGFRFEVPKKGQVVYLGSLSIACRSGRGVFGSLIDSCEDFKLASDPQSAKQFVAMALPGLAVDARPMGPHGSPWSAARLPEWRGALDVVARVPAKIEAAVAGAGLAPWAVIPGTGRPRPIAAYNLMAIGFGLATRAGTEARAADRMAEIQPCVDRLSGSAGTIDYVSGFVLALREAAHAQGTVLDLDGDPRGVDAASSKGVRPRLAISLPILRLRETGRSHDLALELALEARIEAADGRRLGYYGLFYSAPELPVQSPLVPSSPLYARFLPERAAPRPMAAWCGADSTDLLGKEIRAALSRIAAQIAQDFRLDSRSAAGPEN